MSGHLVYNIISYYKNQKSGNSSLTELLLFQTTIVCFFIVIGLIQLYRSQSHINTIDFITKKTKKEHKLKKRELV